MTKKSEMAGATAEIIKSKNLVCSADLIACEGLEPLFVLPPRSGVDSAWYGHVPFAYWVMAASRPRCFVELGTHNGVSYTAFCDAVARATLDTSCFAIDTWQGDEHAGFYSGEVYTDLRAFHDARFTAFSRMIRTTFDDALAYFDDESIDLLHIDGCHSYEAVRHDFEHWRPKLSSRAVVLFHDTNVRERHFGVWRLWAELRQTYAGFEFLHEHGLGVLAIGTEVPKAVLELCNLSDSGEIARIRNRFAFGGRYGLVDSELGRLQKRFALLEETLVNAQQMMDDVRRQAAADAQQAAINLQQAAVDLQQAEVDLQQAVDRRRQSEVEASVLRDELMQSQTQLREAEALQAAAAAASESAKAEADAAWRQVQAVQTSTTWRATESLRRALSRSPRLHFLARQALRAARSSRRRIGRPHLAPAQVTTLTVDTATVDTAVPVGIDYTTWAAQRDLTPYALDLQRRMVQESSAQPLVSILTPVYQIEAGVLDDTIHSVVSQTYHNWELCLVVADSADGARMDVLRRWTANDPRIRMAEIENGGIARNSNAALAMARGEWAVLLDHDDLLTPDALFELVRAALADPDAAMIYSDKDQIGADGMTRQHPLLKPAWAPDIMLNANYLTHLNLMRVERLRDIGGWDPATDGAQDWDLFFRVIGVKGRVRHVPRVLYHWRQVPTSVASGGFDAKPYAADGQLRAVTKHLQIAGWAGANARFEGQVIRVEWPSAWRPSVSLLICRNGAAVAPPHYRWPGEVEVLVAPSALTGQRGMPQATDDAAASLDALAAAAKGDILVVWDAGLDLRSEDWLSELVGPLVNPAIAAVAGAVYRADDTIDAMGAFSVDGEVLPGFHGLRHTEGGPFGNSAWYGNASMAPLRLCALRRSDWRSLQAHRAGGRADISFMLDLARDRGRILLNPFATATARECDPFTTTDSDALRARITAVLPDGDPFVSPHLTFAETGWLSFRQPHTAPVIDHNFAAEARHTARAYDATAEDVQRSIAACAATPIAPLSSACWIVPPFSVPFYGGIYTILRTAEFMRTQHGVRPAFAVLGPPPGQHTPEAMQAIIGRAFPALATEATIEVWKDLDQICPSNDSDALISTLWTTAFAALRIQGVRRKFYFVQDWEPLFYPAGSISGLVEATYRFGFHGICNTPALAESYRALGGTAEHFLPAVDALVFRRRRHERPHGTPFRLFCYARPATPRNGFETLAVALQALKQRHGEAIDIVTAGAEWQPEVHGLGGVVRHLGLLPYADTGALYRACDAGLVAMATRHPSYLPFELMACGAAVVTNRNPYTAWLLRDGENASLYEMTHGDIVRAVEGVMLDEAARRRVVQGGYDTIQANHADWAETCGTIHGILDRVCRGQTE